jgi:hypothetical protein
VVATIILSFVMDFYFKLNCIYYVLSVAKI